MTVLFPTGRVKSVQRFLSRAQGASRSPFSGRTQVQDWGGAVWRYSVECAVIKGRAARELSAFFVGLDGLMTPFLFADPSLQLSLPDVGTLHRTPIVSGGGQTGTSLVTSGWDASTLALRAGDFFSLGADENTRLYQVTADALADAAGVATLSIRPALRSSPLDGDSLEVDAPKVALRLLSVVPNVIRTADKFTYSFDAEEAL